MRREQDARGGREAGPAAGSGRVWVGTCGYSYTEWTEAGFYPPGTKADRMLGLYARRFPAAELNYTWYQMPRAEAVERQRRQAPPGFLFAAKLTRSLTHEVEAAAWRGQAAAYRHGIAPLVQAGQLSAVLVQLPPTFTRTPDHRRHLAALLDELAGLPLVVEFRHVSWASDRVFAELEKRRVALAAVDEPDLPGLFPALDVVTNPDLFYVRFHGRNARGWRTGNKQLQFDYDYSEVELREWIEKRLIGLAGRARRGLVFFNNHVGGQAAWNALSLTRLLGEYGLALGAV
ncbi:MAG: DUF72 domain-containing protein [Proteobacteria bacterium]|nr:DUF72 domain-containing protein [Pseudomonadota bacterium]